MQGIRKKWWVGALAVVVVAGGLGSWLLLRGGDTVSTTAATTVTVSAQTVKQTVSATGTIEPLKTADLDFAVPGTVTAVLVKEGDKVTRGQALAEIDDTALAATQTAASASLAAAKSQLTDDAGASAVQIASDKANIVSAQASLDQADQDVEDATLRATISGTVTAFNLEVGDRVGSSSGAGGGTANASSGSSSAVTIVSNGTWLVDGTVSSTDVASIKPGLQAQLTVTGVTATVFGTVDTVGLVAQTSDSGAAVFPVTITVTGKRSDLFAGTSATASIVVKQTPNVITVASRALKTSGGTTYVMKVVKGKATKQVVTTGQTYGPLTQITKGLADGDVVQVPGFTRLPGSGSGGTGRGTGSGGFGGFGGGSFGGGFGGGAGAGVPGQAPGGGSVTEQK